LRLGKDSWPIGPFQQGKEAALMLVLSENRRIDATLNTFPGTQQEKAGHASKNQPMTCLNH